LLAQSPRPRYGFVTPRAVSRHMQGGPAVLARDSELQWRAFKGVGQ